MPRFNGVLKANMTAHTDGDAVLNLNARAAAGQLEHVAVARANHEDVVVAEAVDPWSAWWRK